VTRQEEYLSLNVVDEIDDDEDNDDEDREGDLQPPITRMLVG
jgi:hypothetical protein